MMKVKDQEYAFSNKWRLESDETYEDAEYIQTEGPLPEIQNIYHEHCEYRRPDVLDSNPQYNGGFSVIGNMKNARGNIKEVTIIAKNGDVKPVCSAVFKVKTDVSSLRKLNKVHFKNFRMLRSVGI